MQGPSRSLASPRSTVVPSQERPPVGEGLGASPFHEAYGVVADLRWSDPTSATTSIPLEVEMSDGFPRNVETAAARGLVLGSILSLTFWVVVVAILRTMRM